MCNGEICVMDDIRFSVPEILSLFGIAQCIYLLVYMILRSGRLSRAGLPAAYFFVLALAFLSDLAAPRVGQFYDYYFYVPWFFWFMGPPLSVLMVIQIAQIYRTPSLHHYYTLLLVPVAFAVGVAITSPIEGCGNFFPCEERRNLLTLTGILAGGLSLLTLWLERDLFSAMGDRKTGKERYWLVLAIIFMNIIFLGTALVTLGVHADEDKITLVRTMLGLGLVYLLDTSLFRIYPQAVLLTQGAEKNAVLSPAETEIARKIEKLFKVDKVYHEATYTRAELARECRTSEAVVSKVINKHLKKSFPQVISEYRVEDAKRLLNETDASIKIIAAEVGFSSLASFNRVFREIAGETPSEYRRKPQS
jgi:AraC-like DNA-binding protein